MRRGQRIQQAGKRRGMPKARALRGSNSGLAAVQKCHCLCDLWSAAQSPSKLLGLRPMLAEHLPPAACRDGRCGPAACLSRCNTWRVLFCLPSCAAAQPCLRREHGSQAVQGAVRSGPAASDQLAPMHTAQPASERTLRMALWAGSTRITSKYLYTASCGHGRQAWAGRLGGGGCHRRARACKRTNK